jgi:hypothetical protein
MKTQYVLDRLFYNKYGQMFISALFGLSLALLFSRVCKENCTLYFAPKYDEINNKTFKLNDVCYKYKIVDAPCNNETLEPNKENYKASNQIEEPTFVGKLFA